MNKTVVGICGALAIILCGGTAGAEWKGKGALGLAIASGNTETETLNAKVDMSKATERWKHSLGGSGLRSRDEEGVTGDRYEFHGQSDYSLSTRDYVSGSLRYESDQFGPFTYQGIGSLSYGHKFLDAEDAKLAVELGVGYRYTKLRPAYINQGDAIARGAINYEQKLSASTSVYDKFLVEAGSDNTFLQNEVGIEVKMTDQLALSIAHVVRHNTDVDETADPPIEKTDQLLTANLVFSF